MDITWLIHFPFPSDLHLDDPDSHLSVNIHPFLTKREPLVFSASPFASEYKLKEMVQVANQVKLDLLSTSLHVRRLGVRSVTLRGLAISSSGNNKQFWRSDIDVRDCATLNAKTYETITSRRMARFT